MNTNFKTDGVNAGRVISGICAFGLLLASAPLGLAQCFQAPTGTMVAWFPFDTEDVGLYFNPATGNKGTSGSSVPTNVPGKVGVALSFNGVDNYVDSANTIVTNFGSAVACVDGDVSNCTGNFSIELWINIPAHPGVPMPIVDKRGTGGFGYEMYISGNRIGLQLADGTGSLGYDNYDSPALPLTTGVWHHVAATVKRTSAIRWYFDGASHGSTVPAHTGPLENDGIMRIGANGPGNPGGSTPFQGLMDELSIYNRVLTAAEIQGIYQAGSSGKCRLPGF